MGKKKRDKNRIKHDVDSKQRCEICHIDVNVGTGGRKNFEIHLTSKKHLINVKAAEDMSKTVKTSSLISDFFIKQRDPPPPFQAPSAPQLLAPNTLTLTPAGPSRASRIVSSSENTNTRNVDSDTTSHRRSSNQTGASGMTSATSTQGHRSHPLVSRLRTASARLPESVPVGQYSDPFAVFSGDPRDSIVANDDPWESVIDPCLNRVIGFGVSTHQIADIIRRGPFGIDGFCRWIEICMLDLKISPELLEMKLERVFDALNLLYASFLASLIVKTLSHIQYFHHESGADDEPDDTPAIIESSPSPDIIVISPDRGFSSVSPISPIASNKHRSLKPVKRCHGLLLNFGDGRTPAFSYPSQIHGAKSVPWTTLYSNEKLWIQSNDCKHKIASGDDSETCPSCRDLLNHAIIQGIMERDELGARENTPYQWLSYNHTSQLLHRKNNLINDLKLARLNLERSLLRRARSLSDFKRFLFAVSRGNIPRLHSLVATAQKRGSSIRRILELIDLAVQQVYKPKGYSETDFQRQFLFLKLGGQPAADLAHRTCGLPSSDATREHIQTKALVVSAKMPTLGEMTENLNTSFQMGKSAGVVASSQAHRPRGPGYQEMADELKVELRLRWDASRNIILGPCREHVGPYSVDFVTMDQPRALAEGIRDQNLHFATEATVIAISHFSKNPQKYAAHPFVISGSCKHEDVQSQRTLLQTAVTAASDAKVEGRLYCLSSDGDSRRRRATAYLTLIRDLEPWSELRDVLGELALFNYVCGDNEITANIDTLHLMKRMRNTCIRAKGTTISGALITPQVLKRHLSTLSETTDLTDHRIDKILSPNDKQDVKLAYDLLSAVASLPPAAGSDIPTVQTTRQLLRLLGCIHAHVLETYTNIDLSLHEQLVHLSALAHLYLAIYSVEKGNFVPSQLYFDVQTCIKNAFFCVAKTKLDDPDGQFWLILLGTDALEHLFGVVRTMISTDANADLLQLGNRLEAAATCCCILAEHPEWVRGPRRLSIRNWRDDPGNTSSKFDHINPESWRGNVYVKDVVILTSWTSGRRLAEQELKVANFPVPFGEMEGSGNIDMLRPFGDGKVVLLNGLSEEERDEDEDEQDVPALVGADGLRNKSDTSETNPDGHQPDIEDTASELLQQVPQSYNPYIEIDYGSGKSVRQHKSTVCRILSEPHAVLESTDRLKRVRGYSRYQEAIKDIPLGNTDNDESNAVLQTQDPAAFLVRSKDLIWLAIGEIVTIKQQNTAVDVLPVRLLAEPNIHLTMRIMELAYLSGNEKGDWEWTGQFTRSTCDVDGHSVQLIDPTVIHSTRPGRDQMPTYCFQSSELLAIAAALYGNTRSDIDTIPSVSWCETFPYRLPNGSVCFICEDEGSSRGEILDEHRCPHCPTLRLPKSRQSELVSHMGMHILHDNALKNVPNPCGFCLSPGSLCSVRLKKGQGRKVGMQIDLQNSRCQYNNQVKLSLKTFSKSTSASPCTNVPIMCPLCPTTSDAVWKYNLESHLKTVHPTANISEYRTYYEISKSEFVALKNAFTSKPRWTAKRIRSLVNINISEAHSSRVALRTTHMDGSPGPDDDLDQDHYTSNGNQAQTDMDLDAPQDSEFSDSSGDDISGIRTDSQRLGTPTSPGQVKTVQMPATPNRRRSKRARTNKSFGADQEDCAESDCEDPSSQEEKVVCAGPGCNAMDWMPCRPEDGSVTQIVERMQDSELLLSVSDAE